MSDVLRDGAAARGGPSVRTPREVMANRRAREERKQQEADKVRETQRLRAVDADADARSAATAAAARAADDARVHQHLRASAPQRQAPRPQDTQQPPKSQTMPGHRRSQTAQAGLRQSSAPSPQHAAPPPPPGAEPDEPPSRANTSSFPHAFERWEQLSSHWEGLTSYWLHKIEANTDEVRRNVPSAAALSRQIQDLSAAGANLFHAVVELQRLRASSERKFQRWFFETRAEQERTQETTADMARQLQTARDAQDEAAAAAARGEAERRNTERVMHELRRELAISKNEAKRAWEDLGRIEADQHAWIGNLRQGLPTVIGGVQVVPLHAASAAASHRSSGPAPAAPSSSSSDDDDNAAQPSPAATDPFPAEPRAPSLGAAAGTPVSTSTARTAISPQQQRRALTPPGQTRAATPSGASPRSRAVAPSDQGSGVRLNQAAAADPPAAQHGPELFYQHPPGTVYLHSSSSGPDTVVPPVPDAPRSRPSYGSDTTEGTEYIIDHQGQVRRDAEGRPVVYHPNVNTARGGTHSSDSYDVEADVARERELAAHYGVQAQTTPATSAEAMASFVASADASPGGYSSVGPADYEGSGYGASWETLQTRHHHPTRLSDVLEEDERSRTTAE